jgi:Spx/MgsR family transcriptional regulator
MTGLTLYGIPNCDTVKKARAWLDAHGVAHAFVDLRKSPPSSAQLAGWIAEAGWERLLNRRGTTWRTLDAVAQAAVTDERSARELMEKKPAVIRRPVVESAKGLVVGFDADDWAKRFGHRG